MPKVYKHAVAGPFWGAAITYNALHRFYTNKEKYNFQTATKVTAAQFLTSTTAGTVGGILGGITCLPLGPVGTITCSVLGSEVAVQVHDGLEINGKPLNEHVADFIADTPSLSAEPYGPPCPSGMCSEKPVASIDPAVAQQYINSFQNSVQQLPTGVIRIQTPVSSVSGEAIASIVCAREDKSCIAKFSSNGKDCSDPTNSNCHEISHTKCNSPSGNCADTKSTNGSCGVDRSFLSSRDPSHGSNNGRSNGGGGGGGRLKDSGGNSVKSSGGGDVHTRW